ncbi:hypothetical protein BH11PLA2_BH11PLA2_30060 [soil metagenome]
MRQLVRTVAVALIFSVPMMAADTPAAEFTKSKRLIAKVTVSVKEKPLKAALEEIADQLEAQKLGRLRFEITPAASTSSPANLSVEAKDLPLATVLGNLLGPHGLKATVVSSEIEKTDGWLRIGKGEVKAAVTGPAATAEEEKDAKLKFETAKQAIADGKKDDAKFLLSFIVKKYPTAAVTEEAKSLLEAMKP